MANENVLAKSPMFLSLLAKGTLNVGPARAFRRKRASAEPQLFSDVQSLPPNFALDTRVLAHRLRRARSPLYSVNSCKLAILIGTWFSLDRI